MSRPIFSQQNRTVYLVAVAMARVECLLIVVAVRQRR